MIKVVPFLTFAEEPTITIVADNDIDNYDDRLQTNHNCLLGLKPNLSKKLLW